MIIQSSNVHMSAEHEKTELNSLTKVLDVDQFESAFSLQLERAQASFSMSSQNFFASSDNWWNPSQETAGTQPSSILVMTDEGLQFRTEDKGSDSAAQQEMTKARLWESLLNAINPRRDQVAATEVDLPETDVPESGRSPGELELKPLKLEMSFKVTEHIEEYECSSFESCGKVTTADGREIEFDMNLTMERSYSATREYEVTEEVVFTDPLMLNFDGNYADLSDEKFEFDLDADGENELISYLMGNSGMLALDKNEDGVINDGTELFGALSGNGFADLAQYDEDGNNYIDEADSIFADLKIWTKQQDTDKLESLADKGIGAIYLGSTETPFDIKGEDNQQNGRVRSSGIYLTESGNVGTVQQVDMVV